MLRTDLACPLFLAVTAGLIVLAVHWPVLRAQAVSLDDTAYLFENPVLQHPSPAAAVRVLREAFGSSRVEGYYEPLTLISLMIDVHRGGRPGHLQAFHVTSLALHVLNTMLVVVLLYVLLGPAPGTGALRTANVGGVSASPQVRPPLPPLIKGGSGGAMFVAAAVGLLFGLHPLTVEPVAWVWERKTVLAAFFALLCLIFYVRYTRRHGAAAYGACLVMFVLSLMAKPTGTPLPVLLLLWDFWPLRRLTLDTRAGRGPGAGGTHASRAPARQGLSWRAVAEKIPFFVVAGVSAVITVISTGRSAGVTLPGGHSVFEWPLKFCDLNAFYLGKIVWPARLSSLYALPEPMSLSQLPVLGAAAFTCVLILLLIASLRWTRALLTSWLFFVIALLPTMGVIGYSWVAASDKYVYLPAIGLLVPLAWLLGRLWGASQKDAKEGKECSGLSSRSSRSSVESGFCGCRRRNRRRRLAVASVVVLLAAAEGLATRGYLRCWQNTESLCRHAVAVDPGAFLPHKNLAEELLEQGRLDEAIAEFDIALRLKPSDAEAHNNRGLALARAGRIDEATKEFLTAIRLRPAYAEALTNMGNVAARLGRPDEAARYYLEALRHKADYPEAHYNLGNTHFGAGRTDEAIEQYRLALRAKPDWPDARNNLGRALAQRGRVDEAIAQYEAALAIEPRYVPARFNLCDLLVQQGRADEAIRQYGAMLQLAPNLIGGHLGLAHALTIRGRLDEAARHYREALRIDPSNADAAEGLRAAISAPATRNAR